MAHDGSTSLTQKYRDTGSNHNNNLNPTVIGGYFDHLEEENFYLRTQLQKLLQELHLKEELINGAQPSGSELKERRDTGAYDAAERGNKNVSSNSLVQLLSVRDTVQVLHTGVASKNSMLPARSTTNASTSPGYELPTASQVSMHTHNAAVPSASPSVAALESKLEALERKYQLQAQRHQQLTNELSLLRHQTSLEMDAPTASAEVQTSPEEDIAHWPLPAADAVHGSPQRHCTSRQLTTNLRRNVADSGNTGAQYSLVHDPFQAGCSSATTGGCSTVLCSEPTRLRKPLVSCANSAKMQVIHKPGREELMQWVRDRPPNSRLFRALFQYLPHRDSPNDNPDSELALEPGDYILVHGQLDEDGFYEGELFNGQVGLVPSNYVERVVDSELYANARGSNPHPVVSASAQTHTVANHSTVTAPNIKQSSLLRGKHVGNPSGAASSNVGPAPSRMSYGNPGPSVLDEYPIAGATVLSSGLLADLDALTERQLPESLCPYPPVDVSRVTVHEIRQPEGQRVPCPRDILVEKQLQKSLVISWSAPENALQLVSQYHVCVDGLVKAVVPGGYKHKALIEDVDLNRPHRVSVRAVTEKGHSADASCTITVGLDATVAPQEVRTCQITPVSVQLSWYPSNSNCEHIILLNGVKVGACPAGVHQVLLKGLSPSTMYRASVRTKDPRAVLEERPVEGFIDFKTLPKIGLPDPPAFVQCDPGPQDGTLLISWKPVQNQPKPPSRAAVSGYLVYADGRKVSELNTPNGDHVLLRLSDFIDDPPLFITVRTRTREGAISADSNVVRVPRAINPSATLSPQRRITAMESSQAAMLGHPPVSSAMPDVSVAGGGLLMVQPSSGPSIVPGAPTQPPVPLYPSQVPQVSAVGQSHLASPAVSAAYQATNLPSVPTMQVSNYGVWPTVAVTTLTYTQPSAVGPTSTVLSSLGGPPIAGQYYVFHPKLSRADPTATDKPSLLEMENSYLVKHSNPFAPALPAPRTVLTGAQAAASGMYGWNPMPSSTYPSQAVVGAPRALPVIDPSTGLPFRSDQYASAWQTLSPATRRRLAQYVNQQPSGYGSLNGRDAVSLLRRDILARKRAALRKRSYSADEQMEDYAIDSYGRVVPQIRITGASGSEGAGSVIDFSEEDWEYAYGRKPSSRRRFGYYHERASSRAHSEPDLRVDDRLMAPDNKNCRIFVALYDYDPRHMSPNPNAIHEELTFRKGQVIKVYGPKDLDGFYQGEHSGRVGLIPSNMVTEMDKEDYATMRHSSYRNRDRDYDHYYDSMQRRQPSDSPVGSRRRSDAGWTQNSSDPLLSRYRASGHSDYESSGSMDRGYGPPVNPRVRRMRFAQLKSQSYDYGDKRRGREEYAPSAAATTTGYRKHTEYPPTEYDSDRRYPSEPPYSSRSDRGQVGYYRGSLDKRDRERARDHSLPARTPPEEYPTATRRQYDAPPYERIATDRQRPQFQVGGAGEMGERERMEREREYYERGDREPRELPATDYRRPETTRERDRYYNDERRTDYREREREPAVTVRDSQIAYERDATYGRQPLPEEERYRSEVDPRLRRGAQDYPAAVRGGPDYNGMPPRQDAAYGQQANDARYPKEPYYDRERRRGSFRRGGRDHLEQNIREAIKDVPPRKMIAKFDYDPRELSPNVDAEQVELNFRAGDLILIYGEMDEDGFFIGELNGKRGLVPSNFLEHYTGPGMAQQGALPSQSVYPQSAMPPMEPQRPKRDGVTFSDDAAQQQSLPNRPTPATASAQVPRAMPKRQESVASAGSAKPAGGSAKPKASGGGAPKAGGPAKKTSDGSGKAGGQRKASQAAGPKKPDAAKKK